jgi:lysophospholipase L1-like esterase
MPLGDSITYGTNGDATAGYLGYLLTKFPTVIPVGSISNPGAITLTALDKNHSEGHGAFWPGDLRKGLADWLAADGAVDAILCHAGTNGESLGGPTAANEIRTMYNIFMAHNPAGIMLIADPIIPPRTTSDAYPGWLDQNKYIAAMVPMLPRAIAVSMADFTDADLFPGQDLHPQASGYEKMAAAWAGALTTLKLEQAP